jgi:chorismate-pyruvate lyase
MGELACHFPHLPPGDLLLRTYRMLSSGRPLMLLSEYFPA